MRGVFFCKVWMIMGRQKEVLVEGRIISFDENFKKYSVQRVHGAQNIEEKRFHDLQIFYDPAYDSFKKGDEIICFNDHYQRESGEILEIMENGM